MTAQIPPEPGRGAAQRAVEGRRETDEPIVPPQWQPPRQLGSAIEFQLGIETIANILRERHRAIIAKQPITGPAEILLSVISEPARPTNWLATLDDGTPVGHITSRTKLGQLLASGQHVARAKVKSIEGFYQDQRPYKLNALFCVGPPGCEYIEPVIPPPTFPLRLVGEQYHAPALARCNPGDRVMLVHESDNPHDDRALAVLSPYNELIGYIPRDGWLQRALLNEGNGHHAIILHLFSAERGFRKAIIQVTLAGDPIGTRRYAGAPATPIVIPAKAGIQPRSSANRQTARSTPQDRAAMIFALLLSFIIAIVGMIAKHG